MVATALITGASSGIGKATARLLAEKGYQLILTARRADRLEALKASLEDISQSDIITISLDVRDRGSIETVLSPYADQIQILINNAGLALGLEEFDHASLEDWDTMLDTNVKGLLYVTHFLLPQMKQQPSAHIINIGSIAGHEVYPKGAVYCASKHAVKAISQGLKHDLIGTNVRVTSIDPGLVETEFSLVRFHGDNQRAKQVYENLTPLKPEDIAECIAFAISRPPHVNITEMIVLASEQASATRIHRKNQAE